MKARQVEILPCPFCGANPCRIAEKREVDKALGELYDLTEWEDAEAAIRELHARGPEIERLYLDSKILPGELRALVMVSNCLEREFVHRQLATGQPLHMNVL